MALAMQSGFRSSERMGVRMMSIMDRYRKVRPAPDVVKQWEPSPSFVKGIMDATESTESIPQHKVLDSHRSSRLPAYSRNPVPSEALSCFFEKPIQPEAPRILRVGLVGPPNSGKSSLMNAIIGRNVSAVSPKVNTTRDGVRGILTTGNTQLVFLDVPGIIPSEKQLYTRELVSAAWRGFHECDLCILVVDVVRRPTQEFFDVVRRICPHQGLGQSIIRRTIREADGAVPRVWLPQLERSESGPPVILVLNKIDKASEFRWVQSREKEFVAHGSFRRVFYASALKNQGLEKLMVFLAGKAQPGNWMYPAELHTTLSHTEQIQHTLTNMLFKWFNKDLPYKIQHQTVGWTPRLDGSLLVEHELIVSDTIVARIVCGVRNTLVSRLKEKASFKLSKMWDVKVELDLWVRPLKERVSDRDRKGLR